MANKDEISKTGQADDAIELKIYKNNHEANIPFIDADEAGQASAVFVDEQTKSKRSRKEFQENYDAKTDLSKRFWLQRSEDQKIFHEELCNALSILRKESDVDGDADNDNGDDGGANDDKNENETNAQQNNSEAVENDETIIDYQDETVDIYSPKFIWSIFRTGFIIYVSIAIVIFTVFIIYFGFM